MVDSSIYMSEDELINHLKRSNLLTILVEGIDDAYLYRILEEKYNSIYSDGDIDILPCQGRETLLKIFDRRSEFPHTKVVFIADQDMWIFTGIPSQYNQDIIFTKGYSIENDLYIKDIFESLLEEQESHNFDILIKNLSEWFAFEVNNYIQNGNSECGIHINRICCPSQHTLLNSIKNNIISNPPPENLINEIYQEYYLKIRGKNLFQALIRFLSHKNRKSKYSIQNLYEMSAKFDNPNFKELAEKIKQQIAQIQ